MDTKAHLLLLVIISFVISSQAFVGYDCGSSRMNISTVSLLEVGDCDVPADNVKSEVKFIQLLQLNDFVETDIIQCKVELRRTIYNCGMFSHVSIVAKGVHEYLRDMTREECETMYVSHQYRVTTNHVINDISKNSSKSYPVILAGTVTNEGKCTGEQYSDNYGTWSNVVVQGTVKITLVKSTARVNTETDKIYLPSGTICVLSKMQCMDSENGFTYWSPAPADTCGFNKYSILFDGPAVRSVDTMEGTNHPVYTLTAQKIIFGLTTYNEIPVCGYRMLRTEHPKLFIFEHSEGESFAKPGKLNPANLDLFAYMNSKFVFVEKQIGANIRSLYRDVLKQRCRIEQQTIRNSLAIATTMPDQFAYNLMKGPGYMAVTTGEVVHIVKCIPVEVRMAKSDFCFAELPVTLNNATYYLTPKTHILKSHGTRVSCNNILPPMYHIDGFWYKIMPSAVETNTPRILKPLSEPTWNYKTPQALATSGIYTNEDIDKLREYIMFPVEKATLLDDIARDAHENTIIDNEGRIFRLPNANTLDHIAESTWRKIWDKFMTFGSASAGLIAIIMVLQILKMVVDIVINGYVLHRMYGWSIHLLGAIWSSLAHLLIFLSTPNDTQNIPRTQHELEEVNTQARLLPKSVDAQRIELQGVEPTAPKVYPELSNTNNINDRNNSGGTSFFALK